MLFAGYEFVFIAIDKKSGQIGLFDCSDSFYRSGEEKVEKASEAWWASEKKKSEKKKKKGGKLYEAGGFLEPGIPTLFE